MRSLRRKGGKRDDRTVSSSETIGEAGTVPGKGQWETGFGVNETENNDNGDMLQYKMEQSTFGVFILKYQNFKSNTSPTV